MDLDRFYRSDWSEDDMEEWQEVEEDSGSSSADEFSARAREARALRRRREREKAGRGGGDADEERMILDFRFGFEGSVFERLHVSPVQLAKLSISFDYDYDADLFPDFISEPGRLDLMKESVDDFGANFKDYCRTQGVPEKEAVLLADMATDFAAELLRGEKENDDDDDSDSSDGSDEEEEDTRCTEEVEEISMLFLRHWVSNLSSPRHGQHLARWGTNVDRESDQTIGRKIYAFCEKKIRSYHKKPLGILLGNVSGFLVDFDLVGADGRKYPLRMLKFIGGCEDPNIWQARISERETGALIAKGLAHNIDNNAWWEEHVRVVAEELIERQYKPHGDIPTMLRGWFTQDIQEHMRRAFAVMDDGVGKLYVVSSPEEWRVFLPCRPLLPEELESLSTLHKASDNPGYLSYSRRSEVERLIPVAALLARLDSNHHGSFRWFADELGLRLSTMADVKRRRRAHFARLFKGSIWEQLPEELISRIVDYLSPGYIICPPQVFNRLSPRCMRRPIWETPQQDDDQI